MMGKSKFVEVGLWKPSSAINRLSNHRKDQIPLVFTCGTFVGPYVTIPEGFKAIVRSWGKDKGIWEAGYHSVMPWQQISIPFLIPESHFVFDTPVKQCPTSDNVNVEIDISLVVKIITERVDHQADPWINIKNFCYKAGAEQLTNMLTAKQEEEVRTIARGLKYRNIFDLMDDNNDETLEGTKKRLNAFFKDYGVEITDIAVTNIRFEDNQLLTKMSQTAILEQQRHFQQCKHDLEMVRLKTSENQMMAKQKKKEAEDQSTKDFERAVAEANKELQTIKQNTHKELAKVVEKQKADIMKIQAESKLRVAQINKAREVELKQVKSTGEAQAQAMEVEAKTHIQQVNAEAELTVATNQAKALKFKSEAELKASKQLISKRDYDLKFKHLRVVKGLASNPNVAISGDNTDNQISQLLSGSNAAMTIGLKN